MFEVAADAYDRFMGVYSAQLAPQLADFAGVRSGQRVIDVGCGPGTLTAELVARLGAENVVAADPSDAFVAAARQRYPGVDVRSAPAEALPFADGSFDAALAQLVVHFMTDPVAGLREMGRVTREGGTVAANVWDLAGGRAPIDPFWRAAKQLRDDVEDESGRPGARAGHLADLFRSAGLRHVEEGELTASVRYERFEDWWEPYMHGVGPAGAFVQKLDEEGRAELRERARRLLPEPPFTVDSVAWAARARA
ncbi:MAG: class I SAM-dependent methyltransferase [Actinobacteria bacterium]|nr:MAG: class I SAM-dependent methyltransferase [Actinomycetota bacterium]